VAICGLATDYCVAATAADANSLGFETTVLLPWSAAIDQEQADQKMSGLQGDGVKVLA
jgi:nicotinamidase/pyrazinamidase